MKSKTFNPGVDGLFRACQVAVAVHGRMLPCRFYPVAPEAVASRPRIASGDWVEYRLEQESQPERKFGN
jgi:hypothetical protein